MGAPRPPESHLWKGGDGSPEQQIEGHPGELVGRGFSRGNAHAQACEVTADESHGALPSLPVSRLAAAQGRVPQTGIPPPAAMAHVYQQLRREGRGPTAITQKAGPATSFVNGTWRAWQQGRS